MRPEEQRENNKRASCELIPLHPHGMFPTTALQWDDVVGATRRTALPIARRIAPPNHFAKSTRPHNATAVPGSNLVGAANRQLQCSPQTWFFITRRFSRVDPSSISQASLQLGIDVALTRTFPHASVSQRVEKSYMVRQLLSTRRESGLDWRPGSWSSRRCAAWVAGSPSAKCLVKSQRNTIGDGRKWSLGKWWPENTNNHNPSSLRCCKFKRGVFPQSRSPSGGPPATWRLWSRV